MIELWEMLRHVKSVAQNDDNFRVVTLNPAAGGMKSLNNNNMDAKIRHRIYELEH